MSLILDKDKSTEYTFPSSFSVDPPPWAKRLNELERAYKHGSVITGDEKVQARPLRVWGTLYRANRVTFAAALDEMNAACYRKNQTFHATEHWTDRYLNIPSIANFSYTPLVTLFAADIEAIFRITDPFWYSDAESLNIQNGLRSGNLVSFIGGGQIEISPTIYVIIASGRINRITLQNNSDEDRNFTYERTMSAPKGFRIRCATGQVHHWDGEGYVEDAASFDGAFYRILAGSNAITVAVDGSAEVNVSHYWRIKWLG